MTSMDAVVDRERRAQSEEVHGDQERPQVALASVTERVLGTCGSPRPSQAEQQEQLVAGVGERVRRLGEHGAAARDETREDLATAIALSAARAVSTLCLGS